MIMPKDEGGALAQLRVQLKIFISCTCVAEGLDIKIEVKLGVFKGEIGNDGGSEILTGGAFMLYYPDVKSGG